MKSFGLQEFIELTGIGAGRYGIYHVGKSGVVAGEDEDLADWSAKDQLRIMQAVTKLSLKFPCSPEAFMEWYDATRGTNGVSDFPLARGFLDVLRPAGTTQAGIPPEAVPSTEIVAAFRVESNATANARWWDDRMRAAKRYGLLAARASPGGAKKPSYWNPTLVASWLIEKNHLHRDRVLRAMETAFPDYETHLL
jgi:hypothetical protein